MLCTVIFGHCFDKSWKYCSQSLTNLLNESVSANSRTTGIPTSALRGIFKNNKISLGQFQTSPPDIGCGWRYFGFSQLLDIVELSFNHRIEGIDLAVSLHFGVHVLAAYLSFGLANCVSNWHLNLTPPPSLSVRPHIFVYSLLSVFYHWKSVIHTFYQSSTKCKCFLLYMTYC